MASIHASCVVAGEVGILIRGPSGAGKSRLARLILAAVPAGGFARLVADDRVLLSVADGRLVARAPPALRGLMELRGRGVIALPHEPAALIRLVVDLTGGRPLERMLESSELRTHLCGLTLPRIVAEQPADALERIAVLTPFCFSGRRSHVALPLALAMQHGNHSASSEGWARVSGCAPGNK